MREGSVVRDMAGSRKCTFVPDRGCDFESDQLSMDFCKVCVDAWKASGGKDAARRTDVAVKLADLDALFQEGKIEANDYVRLRKELMVATTGKVDGAAKTPGRKGFHLLLVERKMFSKKARTFPAGWRPPEAITGKLVESLYSMCKSAKAPTDVSIEVEDVDIACLGQRGDKIALIVVEGGDAGVYRDLIIRVGAELAESDDWESLLRVAASSQG